MSKEAMKLARQIIWRYRHETPLGNQPHMIAHEADEMIERIDQALAKQEEPLPPVEIGVDVTSDGASVVAFYRRPNAVMEMFYSQFHPLAKQEQGEPVAYQIKILGERWTHCAKHIYDLNNPNTRALYTTPQQRTWVGLTDEEVIGLMKQFPNHLTRDIAQAIEAKLKEKNNGS